MKNPRTVVRGLAVSVGLVAIAAIAQCKGRHDDLGGGETVERTQSPLTQAFTLPVPVGFSPV